jgi:hypothetical protein
MRLIYCVRYAADMEGVVGGWDKDGMDMHVRMYRREPPMGRPTIY